MLKNPGLPVEEESITNGLEYISLWVYEFMGL
jgi:hypothetical protein